MTYLLKRIFAFVASYGFAVVLMLLLLLLTLLGTLEQAQYGLYEVQKRYFESLVVVHWFFDRIPVPLPGVYLLLVCLFVNVIAGGVVRMRKGRQTVGVLIVHVGTLVLLFGGFVTYRFARDGHMTLYENQESSEVTSYNDWEIAVGKADGANRTEYIIPDRDFLWLGPGQSRTFTAAGLPFDITVGGVARNCEPMPKGPMFDAPTEVVDGVFLNPVRLSTENEQNVAGLYATFRDKSGGPEQKAVLWGLARHPTAVPSGNDVYAVELRKRRWEVPFTVRLDKFTRELHPGTSMAKSFMSDITKVNPDGGTEKIRISMNEPLREQGFTFFQASWGPADAKPGDPLYSSFAVVRNPADQWPLYACIVVTVGLVLHFGQKLARYIRAESRRTA